jgi:hypothetical protein
MVKKQQRLAGCGTAVPVAVQDAAESFARALRALGTARSKKNGCQEGLIQAMLEARIKEVLIDENNKRIVLDEKNVVTIKKVQDKDATSGDDDDDEGEED